MPRDSYDVVISGMGTSGLVCALLAAAQRKSVLIVTNRDNEFIRVQRVSIDTEHIEFLIRMLSSKDIESLDERDRKFLAELNQTKFIAIKDLEAFIYRRLEKFSALIDYSFYSELSSIDLHAGITQIRDLTTFQTSNVTFRYLIGADGVKHHACNLVNDFYGSATPIQYLPDLSENIGIYLHQYHMSAYLTIRRLDGENLNLTNNMFHTEQADMYFYPRGSIKSEVKCNFASQLPSELIDIQDPQQKFAAALQYARDKISEKLISSLIGDRNVEFSIELTKTSRNPKKNTLKLLFFEINLLQANKAGINDNGHSFLLVGDAFRTPNYRQATGMNCALSQARLISQFLANRITLDKLSSTYAEMVFDTHFEIAYSLPFTSSEQFTLAMRELLETRNAHLFPWISYYYEKLLNHSLCDKDLVMLICQLCDTKNLNLLEKIAEHRHITNQSLDLLLNKIKDLSVDKYNALVQIILNNSNLGPIASEQIRENARHLLPSEQAKP